MLFADEQTSTWFGAVAATVTALIGAWLAIRLRIIDHGTRRTRRQLARERRRCDALEHRVTTLEKALAAARRVRKRR